MTRNKWLAVKPQIVQSSPSWDLQPPSTHEESILWFPRIMVWDGEHHVTLDWNDQITWGKKLLTKERLKSVQFLPACFLFSDNSQSEDYKSEVNDGGEVVKRRVELATYFRRKCHQMTSSKNDPNCFLFPLLLSTASHFTQVKRKVAL